MYIDFLYSPVAKREVISQSIATNLSVKVILCLFSEVPISDKVSPVPTNVTSIAISEARLYSLKGQHRVRAMILILSISWGKGNN
jgi:hypothetical protein